ncbi:MAG: hypothetical protein AB1439_01515 [candidate division FCPU426 bacterium]
MPETKFNSWLRWTCYCAAGEFCGLLAVAWPGWLIIRELEPGGSVLARIAEVVIMMLLGVAEGFVLGWFQWQGWRRLLPQLQLRNWLWATVLAASLAWLLGTLPTVSLAAGLALQTPHPHALLILWSGLIGLVFGGVFGGVQWLELKRHSAHAGLWIPANALGWCLGLVVLSLETALPLEQMSVWETGASLLSASLAAGLVIGGVTGAGVLAALPPVNPRYSE